MTQQGQQHVPSLNLLEVLDSKRNEVRRAQVIDGSADVAVKLLSPAYEPMLPKRFPRSRRTLKRHVSNDPGWAVLLDSGIATDGRAYVVHPYFSAGSLADQLANGPVPWYPASTLIARTAQILGRAHRIGWSFGYLRPSSVLLAGPLEPMVSVYGMSTRRFDDGSAQFMAPEIMTNGSAVPASDVYSLALILASLIVGRPVDHNERVDEVLEEARGLAPARIVEIIDYGLSPYIRNRFADATKMARAVATAIEAPDGTTLDRTEPDDTIDAGDALIELMAEPLVGTVSAPTGPASGTTNAKATNGSSGRDDLSDESTSQPWTTIDGDTDPTGDRFHQQLGLPETAANAPGPLSDLLNGAEARAEPTIDFASRQRSGHSHVDAAQRTRRELEELIDGLVPPATPSPGAEDAENDPERSNPTDGPPASDEHGDDGDDEIGPDSRSPRAVTAPGSGSAADGDVIGLDADDDGIPFAPRVAVGMPPPTADATSAKSRPTRSPLVVLTDHVGHLINRHRRRIASATAITSVVGVTAVALGLGIGAVRANNVSTSEGAPSPAPPTEPGLDRGIGYRAPTDDPLAHPAPLAPDDRTGGVGPLNARAVGGSTTSLTQPDPSTAPTPTAVPSALPSTTSTLESLELVTTESILDPTTTLSDTTTTDDDGETTSNRRRRRRRSTTTTEPLVTSTIQQSSTTENLPDSTLSPATTTSPTTDISVVTTTPTTSEKDDDDGDDD